MRLIKMLLFGLLLVSYPALAADNVVVHFNYPQDTIFIGATNTMQVWVENDDSIKGMALGFEMSGYTGMVIWDMSFGDEPPVNSADEWMNGFSLGGVNLYSMDDSYLPDSILIGEAYLPPLTKGVGPGDLRRCYLLKFDVPTGEPTGTFCVDNIYILPPSWIFDNGSTSITPDYHGCVNSGPDNPDCPAVCFPVLEKNFVCGDTNGDGVVNVADFIYILNYVFIEGPFPPHYLAGDANCNGRVTVGDATYIMLFVFMGGPWPCDDCP